MIIYKTRMTINMPKYWKPSIMFIVINNSLEKGLSKMHANNVIYMSPTSDINECGSSPCVYGTCTDNVNSYTCNCDDGYTGTNCETSRLISLQF